MFTRILTLVTLLATVNLLGDVAQILCFGEDGHVALEWLASDEHARVVASSSPRAETMLPARDASSERPHVDVPVGDAGLKSRTASPMTPATSVAVVNPGPVSASVPPIPGVEPLALCALRTTVLRA